jgi:tetratricopeptide (TPR) repeat protein
MWRGRLILILLFVSCFSLAAWLEPRHTERANHGEPTDSVLGSLLGDGRKMVADYCYVEADVYFHSGYYPSVFDQARGQEEKDSDVSHPEEGKGGGEEKGGFMGEPLDWIDRLSREFKPSRHTHLGGQSVRELLPWLKLSAELDPHRVQTYVVTSYWLRSRLGKSDEALDFIRDGLKQNPHSPDLLFALGQIFLEDRKDYPRARNVLLAAKYWWHKRDDSKPVKSENNEDAKDLLLLERILGTLVEEEEAAGHLDQAVKYLQELKPDAADPGGVQKRIDELQARINAAGKRNQPARR